MWPIANSALLLSISIYLLPLTLIALPSDQQLPYYITADSVTYERLHHRTIYTGHVHVTQGSTEVTADKLFVLTPPKSHRIQELIAFGNLAHYSTVPEDNKARLFAEAKIIHYWPTTEKSQLLQQAKVTYQQNVFTGGEIWYDMKNKTITASKGKTQHASHTTIIIQPARNIDPKPHGHLTS